MGTITMKRDLREFLLEQGFEVPYKSFGRGFGVKRGKVFYGEVKNWTNGYSWCYPPNLDWGDLMERLKSLVEHSDTNIEFIERRDECCVSHNAFYSFEAVGRGNVDYSCSVCGRHWREGFSDSSGFIW